MGGIPEWRMDGDRLLLRPACDNQLASLPGMPVSLLCLSHDYRRVTYKTRTILLASGAKWEQRIIWRGQEVFGNCWKI